jgi:hypothetical protein
MSDDLAVPQLDGAAVEPAPEPVPATSSNSTQGIRQGDRGAFGWIAWLLVAIAAVGMLVSTPSAAGPDEAVQEVTAWYLSGHGLPPSSAGSFDVPKSLWISQRPCYGFYPSETAACQAPRSTYQGMVSIDNSFVANYPPPYYWVVGVGQRVAALVGNKYADIGGRLASFILNFGALLLLSLFMRRRNQWWGTFLLLVSTPLAVFMGIVVNPSGWEITCGIVMAAVLSEAVWSRQSLGSETWSKTTTLILVVASVALSLARPLGFLWASGLTVSAIALAPTMPRRGSLARVACAVAPGIILGMFWLLTNSKGLGTIPGTTASPSTVPNLVYWFSESLLNFPQRLRQMFGDLGWLDTPMPELLFLVNIAAWAALLTRLPSIRRAAIVCGIFGILIVPSAIEAIGWAGWPQWWQGRYTLPFALGFVLLLLLRSGRLIPRTISIVSGISLLSLGVEVWVNAVRYAFGLTGFLLPVTLGKPGISPDKLGFSVAAGLLLVLVSGYLLVRAWKMPPDLVSGVAPDVSSAPAPGDGRAETDAAL